MNDSPEKNALRTLTLCTVKALAKIDKLLNEAPDKKRDRKIQRIAKELEVCNDEAMRIGLQMTAQHIARAKTGRMSLPSPPTVDQQRGTSHRDLMRFHFEHLKGPIGDGGAQGVALKFLLDHYSVEVLKKYYEFQITERWRGKVSWISVKSDIGKWLANAERNGQRHSENGFEFTPQSKIS